MDPHTNSSLHFYAPLMLEQVDAGIALYEMQTFRLLAANTLYQTLITSLHPSWQEGEALDHSFTDWLPTAEAVTHEIIFRAVAETGMVYHAGKYVFALQEGNPTQWLWSLKPVRDAEGRVTHLLQTMREVPHEVGQHQHIEHVQDTQEQTYRVTEVKRHLLEVITEVAKSVHEPFNAQDIGNTALDALARHFHPHGICLHTADAIQQALHLLGVHLPVEREQDMVALRYVPYSGSLFLAQAPLHHEPFLIKDLHTAMTAGVIDTDDPLVMAGIQSVLCIPLWFGDQFEGVVTTLFPDVLDADAPEVHAFEECGVHLAAALAHARLHAAVENERTRLRVVLDQLPEGILLTEVTNGVVSYANTSAEHLLGVPLSELVGTPLDRHLQAHPETDQKGQTLPPWNFALVRALSEETVSAQETLVKKPDGGTMITLCSSAPLFSVHQTLTGAVLVFQDITARKSLEHYKSDFLSMINHELRTPITAIVGLAELLSRNSVTRGFESPRSQRALTHILEQSHHLRTLIETMLDLSRIEQAHFPITRAPHDIRYLLLHAVEGQMATTRRHHLSLMVEEREETDPLIGNVDEERLVQVVNNLISNAIKYSPAGGEIEVGLRVRTEPQTPDIPSEVLIWVKDQGIGIAETETANIFKRFHRSATLDPSLDGLGIGLYLVKEIVSQHGGHVWVESAEGQGSTFYVLLPLMPQ